MMPSVPAGIPPLVLDDACGPVILYTILPLELVLQGLGEAQAPVVTLQVDGRLLEVTPTGTGNGHVVRLYSTNPADYLDPRFCPGALVALGGAANAGGTPQRQC